MAIDRYNAEGYYDPTAYEALSAIEKEENKAAKTFRPLVYISFPNIGNAEQNTDAAIYYSRFCINKGYIPLPSHLLFTQVLDNNNPEEHDLCLFFGKVLMTKCAEIWVFGNTISAEMSTEISWAKRKKCTIRYFYADCKEAGI